MCDRTNSSTWTASLPILCLVCLAVLPCETALAHPHPGGIVVRKDGTIIVGDMLQSRLLIIEPSGNWREVRDVGVMRELDIAADGTIYGVSVVPGQGSSLWTLGPDEKCKPLLPGFNGLIALGADQAILLAEGNSIDRRPMLEMRSADGRRSAIATLGQIDSLAFRDGAVVVADGSSVRTVALDGTVESFADEVGNGLLGLTIGSNGPIVAVYSGHHVVELASGEARRVLLTSEPPWAPTDVTYREGAMYVVEYAEHPCCWKGPRVRRIVAGEQPTTLLTIDDQDHNHPSPWLRLALWIAVAGLIAAALFWIARVVRRRI